MKRTSNFNLIVFFTFLTFVLTAFVVLAWEQTIRDPFFSWVERRYPGAHNEYKREQFQQRVEHFTISIAVDMVVVTLLLRLVDRQQRRLVESEHRYRALFEQASDGIGVVAASDYHLVDANHKFCQILGCEIEGLIGRDIRNIIRPLSAAAPGTKTLAALLEDGETGESELTVESSAGRPVPVAVSFNTLSTDRERLLILILRDLSARRLLEAEREEMQRQLFQTSKLASIGELSAGVAHEINNPLNGIINFAQLLKDEPVERSDFERQMIDGIIDEGGRIAQIVRGLLTFARHDTHELGLVRLADAVKTSFSLFGRQLEKDGVEVELDVPVDLPPVRADGSRLRQVIVNMISNAHHALKAKPRGDEARLFRVTGRAFERDGRRWVRVEFYDNGVGIPPANTAKLFDPFFTTRRDTGGTGLGLSISFGIVRDHGGTIRVESEEGRYTRFLVELPADESEEAAEYV
jgi:PAS domain S-box-containing protein